ncbi:MAG: AAA family ATPase, partial [Bacteroidales bacterium]|nr:AAA family ATPase [Bacteroidales bacterium]
RFTALIQAAYQQTGRKVVVLIDEYDAPLLDVVHEETTLPVLRNVMRNFYSPLKDCDPYLQFVFLTGITKFSQLSIFSELNNLKNISLRRDYAGVCGITMEEMLTSMSDYIDDFAEALQTSREGAIEGLRQQYDGYHFTWPSPDVFNPFSLLNAFQDHDYTNYWFSSGTPTYLIEMLRKFNVVPSRIGGGRALASAFDAPTENMKSIIPLLYQSGYITIKGYNSAARLYTLDIPNNEIRVGLMESLLPNYVAEYADDGGTTIGDMYVALLNDDLDGMFRLLQAYLLTVPYCNNANSEGHYQQMLYVIFSLFGRYVDVEVRTPTGRVDVVMKTGKAIYLFELKLNKSAAAALQQMDAKDYASRFALDGLPVVKVGINFDAERHTLSDWEIKA